MIGVVDYGSGNVFAIKNIYDRLGIKARIIQQPSLVDDADKLILAGVGDYDETMQLLNSSGWTGALNSAVLDAEIPILGVCVGMQIMGRASAEGVASGLGWIDGDVKQIATESLLTKPKLPHMGWNSITFDASLPIFQNIDASRGFYFLHSYHFVCEHEENNLATTEYGCRMTCAIQKDNIYGFQFHPEKSHSNGVALFKNFAELV